ncbi:MAG: hypothetical protein MJK18_02920, partial [Bdellovibrionales bacterium]|nr:hypothetical protein [Bdellovibrionales bacterium]
MKSLLLSLFATLSLVFILAACDTAVDMGQEPDQVQNDNDQVTTLPTTGTQPLEKSVYTYRPYEEECLNKEDEYGFNE